ncbi:uncharacterized protein EI90DRAFT_3018294 [Cantharellus anzutake]|uniref:uncharacterized protein n=1 Tax=Cantharellus anzutake TaxID=1750568 RepID=UPI0019052A3A|nr:uncharacterized protein EI90DRAFT_3018294 [Cantharellus anzutake]KAF8327233.1 hypothetical protein EI90DRAFT_3018294 [Cantharellus anzutake]
MPSIDYRHVHKLTQAWSRSLFPGPAWELMEDIGWYKERLYQPDGTHPRPLTLVGVSSSASDLEILTTIDGRKYLPSPTADDESENWTPPPPVDCFFGPLGDQTIVSLGTFESVSLAKYLSTSTAQVFNVGGPAWGLDWCPMTDGLLKERNYHRYLAVATFPNMKFSLSPSPDTAFSRPACLQLWSYGPPVEEASGLDANVKCEMILCVDDGPSFEIKWYPLPSHDSANIESAVPKLGILAGVFTDGSLSIHSVPDPHHLRSNLGQDVEDPIYMHTKAIFKVFPSNSAFGLFKQYLGTILVYHIKEALLHRKPGETDIPYCVEYAPYIGGVLVPEHDNLLKYYGLFPQLIGHGTTTLIANGPIWDISTSDFHPYVAVACSDGSVMTSCLMKNVRKAGSSAHSQSPQPILQWKAYQMDYNSHTNQYRMLDNFLPMVKICKLESWTLLLTHRTQELTERSQTTKNAKRRKGESGAVAPQEGRSYDGSGAWPAEVGVHRVAWHSGGGLHSAPLLASATASGLCRIEWMKGRGQEGINLYSMIQHLRGGETVAAKTVLSDTEDG